MKHIASTQTNVKLDNQKLILRTLLEKGPMSRAELSKVLRSSKPTISKNVEELIADRRIIEAGKDDNMIGKKGILLDINPDYGHVLAIDMSKNRFRLVIANLQREWLHYYRSSMDEVIMLEKSRGTGVSDIIGRFLDENDIDVSRIRQVTIAYPGVVGHNDTLYLTNLKEKELVLQGIKEYVGKTLDKPILIKNDVNMATIAEKAYGQYRDKKNLYLLSGEVGVGIGIIINHKLYEGDRNAAGEVGFVLPIQHRDGSYYTLEERLSIHALTRRYNSMSHQSITYDELIALTDSGDETALKLYEDVISDMAVAITNVASVLDIQTVIVTGRLFDLKKTIIEDINEKVKFMTPFETDIHLTVINRKALKGAIIVGTESIIDGMI